MKMNSTTVYETERLLLKATSEEDAEFIIALFNMPKWLRFIGDRQVKTIESACDYIQSHVTKQLERLGFSSYTVLKKDDHTKIGTCGLYDREGLEGIDIGFAFLPEYEGKGYAFEATTKLKELAFDSFGITELNAITVKDNLASQKLLEKLGLKRTGTTQLPDDDEELLLYKLKK